jgi:2-hydroxymuconate-semialdehyde hydrolase
MSSPVQVHRRTVVVDGLTTDFLEAGDGPPLVLLHGGEFGAGAQLGWERNIAALAAGYHVLAPDQLGYGGTAKAIDFNEGRRMRIRHVARFCEVMGVGSADFVGNSMGGLNLLVDQALEIPLLPVRRMIAICGGGEILRNEYSGAMFDYDGSFEAMRLIVGALFHDPSFPADDAYVARRHESSIAPGAWEAIAAARFRRPGETAPPPGATAPFERIGVPTLIVEGANDKIKPAGWAEELASSIPGARSAVVELAGHCPQIEQPEVVNQLVLDYFAEPREAVHGAGVGIA